MRGFDGRATPQQDPVLPGVTGLSRGRVLWERQGGNGARLPPPGRGAPSWPLLPLKSQAVFSLECSVEQRVDRSQMKEGTEKQEEAIGSGLRTKSRNQMLAANHPEEEARGGQRGACAHRPQGVDRGPAGQRGGRGGQRHLPYLEQQLEPRDALEGQNQERLEGKALAHGVALQLLQHLAEAAVSAPVWAAGLGEKRGRLGGTVRAWGADTQWRAFGVQWTGRERTAEATGMRAMVPVMARGGGGGVRGPCRARMGAEWGLGLTVDSGRCVPGSSGW